MAVELIGLTPISPVMDDVPVFEIPDFARIAKLQADPRSTEVAPITPGIIAAVMRIINATVEKKENLFLAVFIMPIEFCSMKGMQDVRGNKLSALLLYFSVLL
ncbi:MAG: hypothetical protein ABFC38_12275 [Methanospirillum sp.]